MGFERFRQHVQSIVSSYLPSFAQLPYASTHLQSGSVAVGVVVVMPS